MVKTMAKNNNLSELSDQELVVKIKEDPYYLKEVYRRCKSTSILFLRKYSKGLRHIELDDVFSESCYELYRNFAIKDKPLESSLQTYLNTICRNQLLNEQNKELDINGNIKIKKKALNDDDKKKYNEKVEEDDRKVAINSNYNITNPEWLPDNSVAVDENFTVSKKTAIKSALKKMKEDGGHCAELLVLFWWRKRSMKELTEKFSYKNELTTKTQKARCQKRIKILMQKEV
jgi:DNA-directed RNA polymerase specialized sigma24 family protein